jgi:hypothetical protein
MAKSKTSEVFKLFDVRASFAQLDVAKSFKPGQKKRYELTVLLDPTREDHAKQIALIKDHAKKLVIAQWGEKPEDLQKCFGLADEHPKKKKYDGYKGMFYFVMARNEDDGPATIVGRTKVDEAFVAQRPGMPEWPFSGAFVNTNPTLWAQDNEWGKAIRGNLRIVQFVRKGDAFGKGSADANDEFQALGDAPGTTAGGVAQVDGGFDL